MLSIFWLDGLPDSESFRGLDDVLVIDLAVNAVVSRFQGGYAIFPADGDTQKTAFDLEVLVFGLEPSLFPAAGVLV